MTPSRSDETTPLSGNGSPWAYTASKARDANEMHRDVVTKILVVAACMQPSGFFGALFTQSPCWVAWWPPCRGRFAADTAPPQARSLLDAAAGVGVKSGVLQWGEQWHEDQIQRRGIGGKDRGYRSLPAGIGRRLQADPARAGRARRAVLPRTTT